MNLCTHTKYDFHMQFYEQKTIASIKIVLWNLQTKTSRIFRPSIRSDSIPTIYFNRLTRPSAAAASMNAVVVGVRIAKQQFFRKSLKHRSMLIQWAMKTHHIFQTFIELKTSLFIIIMWIYSFQNGVLYAHTHFFRGVHICFYCLYLKMKQHECQQRIATTPTNSQPASVQ